MRLPVLAALLAALAPAGHAADAPDAPKPPAPAEAKPAAPADPALRQEAQEAQAAGMVAMKDADADPHRAVDAALAFSHALHCYEQLGDVDAVCEMQADIFWCKKRMNLADLQDYVAKKGAGAQRDFGTVQKVITEEVPVSESAAYLERAEKYRAANPDKHFEIAIRYSEVVERFPDTDEGKTASAVFAKEQSAYLAQVSQERKQEQEQLKAELASARKTRFMQPPPVASAEQTPIPDKADQDRALVTVKKTFKDDYTHAKKDAQKRALARKLAAEAEKSRDDAAVYYVLLDESQRLAMETEDYEQLLSAIEQAGMTFKGFDQLAAKRAALAKLKGKPTAAQILKLLDDPADKPANAAVGRFWCFNIGRWDLGLPMLSLGADEDLHKVAEMELAGPKDAAERRATGDAWYELGKKGATADKLAMWTRAQFWYGQALTNLTGVSKSVVEKRVDEIESVLPPVITDYDNITPKQWDRLKGQTLAVEARVNRSDGKVTLAAGERIRVVPHPTDQWKWSAGGVDASCTWKGFDGMTDIFPRRGGGRRGGGGGPPPGALKVKIGEGDEQPPGIITGPGHLWLTPGNNVGALGSGVIRVKLVPVTDDD